jgi:hypothetical protein
VETRFFERQPHPKDVPDDTKHTCRHFNWICSIEFISIGLFDWCLTVEIKRRLPANAIRQPSGQGHSDYSPGVRSTKCQSGQSGPFQWRSPPPPDAVTRRISDSLLYYAIKKGKHIYFLFPLYICQCEHYLDQSLEDADEGEHDRMQFGRSW